MGYRCEEYMDYRYLDGDGNEVSGDDPYWEEEIGEEKEGCYLHFCSIHEYHGVHGDDVFPKPDTYEWTCFMLTDESWEEWRQENPDSVRVMEESLAL
jgi:hypothetical protein